MRVQTWGYGSVPGPEIRVRAGDVLRATLVNHLPDPTSIHWHGVALRNDMDGMPGLTQQPVAPGASFTYEFNVPDPGTYFFHPHVGLLDRALYAPLVVEDPQDPGRYDVDTVIMLDDWLTNTPEEEFARLKASGMGGMGMGGGSPTTSAGGMDMGGAATPTTAPENTGPAIPVFLTGR